MSPRRRLAKIMGLLPSKLVVNAAALFTGGAFGSLLAMRMVSGARNMSAEDVEKLTKKFLPLMMAFSGHEANLDDLDQYACADCGDEFMPLFMLRDELWWTVLTEDERPKQFDMETQGALCMDHKDHRRVAVCLTCCSKRLGRPLHPDDFKTEYLTSSLLADAAGVLTPTPPGPEALTG